MCEILGKHVEQIIEEVLEDQIDINKTLNSNQLYFQ